MDFHHHNINSGNVKNEYHLYEIIMEKVFPLWEKINVKAKFHLSESKPGVKESDNMMLRRAHSDYITFIPDVIKRL